MLHGMSGDDWPERYLASMPDEYRAAFDAQAIALHAAIVQRRGDRPTRVELWRTTPERVIAVCIVAEDRPGLLSAITAALVAHDLDVVAAHAYCRTSENGVREAVDFLWLRRVRSAGGPIRERDVTAIGDMVDALVSGEARFPERGRSSRPPLPPAFASSRTRSVGSTRIRFAHDEATGAMTLTVEATDRPGLLLSITKTLFGAGVQIVALRATTDRGRAVDTFHLVELDGKPLGRDRLFALQNAVLSAIDAATPSSPASAGEVVDDT
jgi:[protein-PII] uridylyltransferase